MSATHDDLCIMSNSAVTSNGHGVNYIGVTSPGNYKKMLIDRYLLSQSKSHGTVYRTDPFNKTIHFPSLEGTSRDVSNHNTVKLSLETGCTLSDGSIGGKLNSWDDEINKSQFIMGRTFCDISARELFDDGSKDQRNVIESTIYSSHNRCHNTFNPNGTLRSPIRSLDHEICNPDSSIAETKLLFNSEDQGQEMSTAYIDPTVEHIASCFLSLLKSVLLEDYISNNVKTNVDHHCHHQSAVMEMLLGEMDRFIFPAYLQNYPLSEIELGNHLHKMHDSLYYPEEIDKCAVHDNKEQYKIQFHRLLSYLTSFLHTFKHSIHDNDNTCFTLLSSKFLNLIHYLVNCPRFESSILNSLFVLCSQLCTTTISFDSVLSRPTSPICTSQQEHIDSTFVETSTTSHFSYPLFECLHLSENYESSITNQASSLSSVIYNTTGINSPAVILTSPAVPTKIKSPEHTIEHKSHLHLVNTSVSSNHMMTTNVNNIPIFNENNNNSNTLVQNYSNIQCMDVDNHQDNVTLSRKRTTALNNCENLSSSLVFKHSNHNIDYFGLFKAVSSVPTNASDKHSITTTNTTTTTTTTTTKSDSNINNSIIQHKSSKRLYACEICSRQFNRTDVLVRHAHVHTGHRPFECNTCGRTFKRSDHLSTHHRTHSGQRPYRCSLCHYSACRRDVAIKHLKVHQKKCRIIPTSESGANANVHLKQD
ncbi:Early growth response protein [Schistosoma japonicum]|uniref:Early growth response protein n=1 Tax=Schistosoma japonicum TaxID=6182 RepID=A0A4Z2CYG1_SCHJA|nr:Early growth response protein [Schistosoma japonicum]